MFNRAEGFFSVIRFLMANVGIRGCQGSARLGLAAGKGMLLEIGCIYKDKNTSVGVNVPREVRKY